jgi:hypothetical protein
MEEIENDPNTPDEGQIGRVIMIVEVVGTTGDEGSMSLKVNSGASPYVAVGFLEVAKQMQLNMMGLS